MGHFKYAKIYGNSWTELQKFMEISPVLLIVCAILYLQHVQIYVFPLGLLNVLKKRRETSSLPTMWNFHPFQLAY